MVEPLRISEAELEKIKAWMPAKPIQVSDGELQRRWTAVRKAMQDRHIEALVVIGASNAGYQRYLCDSPARNHATVFPLDDEMTVVAQAEWGTDIKNPPNQRGVKRLLGWPNSGDAPQTRVYDAELLEKVLEPYSNATIGLVGSAPYVTINYLKTHMREATFIEADEWFDEIQVEKSEEEWELIMLSAEMHDRGMETAMSMIRPGMRTGEVAKVAEWVIKAYGCLPSALNCGSAPLGSPARLGMNQQKPLEEGDGITFLLECAGPGGMYTEVGRTAVIGKAPAALHEELEFAKKAQLFSAGLLKPGARSKDIYAEYNEFMRANGRPEENRIHSHGQGYNLVERPLIRKDDEMKIVSSMNLAVHPDYEHNGYRSWLCDNYRVYPDHVERIHKLEQKVFEVG